MQYCDIKFRPLFSLHTPKFLEVAFKDLEVGALAEGNLIFCCTGSLENYFRSVGRQNSNKNPQFKGRQIKK